MNGLDRATLGVKVSYRHLKHFFPVLQLLTHIYSFLINRKCKTSVYDCLPSPQPAIIVDILSPSKTSAIFDKIKIEEKILKLLYSEAGLR